LGREGEEEKASYGILSVKGGGILSQLRRSLRTNIRKSVPKRRKGKNGVKSRGKDQARGGPQAKEGVKKSLFLLLEETGLPFLLTLGLGGIFWEKGLAGVFYTCWGERDSAGEGREVSRHRQQPARRGGKRVGTTFWRKRRGRKGRLMRLKSPRYDFRPYWGKEPPGRAPNVLRRGRKKTSPPANLSLEGKAGRAVLCVGEGDETLLPPFGWDGR